MSKKGAVSPGADPVRPSADRPVMGAPQVLAALRAHFLDRTLVAEEWALVTEVPIVSGTVERRIDVLALRNWRTRGVQERRAIEIKISRADFARDSEAKRAPWHAVVHRFFYATPAGLLAPAEVPDGCGLLEVGATGRVHQTRRAPMQRSAAPLPATVVTHLARRASRAEETARRREETSGAPLAATEADLARARARAVAAEARASRETRRRQALEHLVATVTAQVCSACGEPLVARVDTGGHARWHHRDRRLDAACSGVVRLHGRFELGPVPASLVAPEHDDASGCGA